MEKVRILYMGWCMPYDNVAHAGGQIFNRYIKEMAKYADVKLIAIALEGGKGKAIIEKYGVDARYVELSTISLRDKIISLNSKYNPWHRYGHLATTYKVKAISTEIKKLKDEDYNPDVIVMQYKIKFGGI